MGLDLLRRIRWGNVGRLAGAAALVAAVVAWPRLAPPEPELPGTVARPLDGLRGATPTATPPAELLVPRLPRAIRRPGRGARRSRARANRDASEEKRPGERRARRTRARESEERGAKQRGGGVGRDDGPGEDTADGTGGRGGGGDQENGTGGSGWGSGAGDPAQTEFGFERN